MTNPVEASKPPESDIRDDRTRRTLELILDPDRAELAMTHFAVHRVEVCVDAVTLEAPNAMLATTATLNMLTRFVGIVELRVIGVTTPDIDNALEAALACLRSIDTRTGKSVRRAVSRRGECQTDARIWIGNPESASADGLSSDIEADVHIAFDGWTCALRRAAPAGEVVASTVPFGALTAGCFAVAEVFKTLVAASVPAEEIAVFRQRFVHDWRFSAWSMDRLVEGKPPRTEHGFDPLPQIGIAGVLQVGAGAVGNATALAFNSVTALGGDLPVLDAKTIDEKNLNRCYFFAAADVGNSKVEVLQRAASRPNLLIQGRHESFNADAARGASIILSTVDNNEVRHLMQEALPDVLVEGATGGTTVAVAVHTPGNGRSCLVCRHPDPEVGATRRVPLSLEDAAAATGLTAAEIASGRVAGETVITDEMIVRVAARSADVAAALRRARDEGQDLCGALGNLRAQLGTVRGPREASVPFVSNLAGILAAAEVVKLLLRIAGIPKIPVLDNVLEIDLARNYARHARLAFTEPPRSDCALCQQRAEVVAHVYERRGRGTSIRLG